MPASQAACDVKQAFDYEKDQQKSVGHILSMTIGGQALAADLELTKPTDFTKQKVVAAIETLSWDGGHASPMSCVCYISVANKQTVATMLHKTLSKTDFLFNFVVWEYDSLKTQFYESFAPKAELKALILKEGKDLQLKLPDAEPFGDVPSPEVWKLEFKVRPQSLAQDIGLATAHGANFVKVWGVTVAA
jgi:hypothetical protein